VPRSEQDREQIVARLRRELGARPEVVLALLHGSFARGVAYRDIDVAIWLDPTRLLPDERFRYTLDLSVHLRRRLGLPSDVRVLNDAPLAVRYRALQGAPDHRARRGVPGRAAREDLGRLYRLPTVCPAVLARGAR
jgi:predicted nucleotidyltransferase